MMSHHQYIAKLIKLVLVCLILNSCVSYKYIDIQYLSKPEIKLPGDFNRAIILANFYTPVEKSKRTKFEFSLDSIAIQEASLSLIEQLQPSPLFEGVEIPIRYNQRNDSSKYIKPLPWSTLNSIAAIDTADLIISLEYLKIKPEFENYQKWNGESAYYYGYIRYSVYCYWRIYDIPNKKIVNGYLFKDTLLWDKSDWTPIIAGNQIPGYFTCAEYVGNEAGKNYSQKIAPVWNDDSRLMFVGGSKEMNEAAILAQSGRWLDAAEKWQIVFKKSDGKLSSKAAFNIALANEMSGKFLYSLEWLKKAKKLYPLPEIDDYMSIVESRIAN